MKAEDLRIGALVYFSGREQVVTKLSFQFHGFENWAQPIPLTKEWLIKQDFNKGFLKPTPIVTYTLDGISIWFKGESIAAVYVGEQRVCDGSKIKYVHLIQNLYHAINLKQL